MLLKNFNNNGTDKSMQSVPREDRIVTFCIFVWDSLWLILFFVLFAFFPDEEPFIIATTKNFTIEAFARMERTDWLLTGAAWLTGIATVAGIYHVATDKYGLKKTLQLEWKTYLVVLLIWSAIFGALYFFMISEETMYLGWMQVLPVAAFSGVYITLYIYGTIKLKKRKKTE